MNVRLGVSQMLFGSCFLFFLTWGMISFVCLAPGCSDTPDSNATVQLNNVAELLQQGQTDDGLRIFAELEDTSKFTGISWQSFETPTNQGDFPTEDKQRAAIEIERRVLDVVPKIKGVLRASLKKLESMPKSQRKESRLFQVHMQVCRDLQERTKNVSLQQTGKAFEDALTNM